MNRKFHPRNVILLLLLLLPSIAFGEWRTIEKGVDYQQFRIGSLDAHVVRVDLTEDSIKVIASDQEDKGRRVRSFAEKHDAIVAINADYFSAKFDPVGLAIGSCGRWKGSSDTSREGVVGIGVEKVEIFEPAHVMDIRPDWLESAVSGWPMLVKDCKALSSAKLPGSDGFTRSPHPRTAVGLSRDKKTMYLVVADGRREGVPGLTLSRLASFMQGELGVCRAINLDGGGSSELVIEGEITNRPSDGAERKVANHLAIVRADHKSECPSEPMQTLQK